MSRRAAVGRLFGLALAAWMAPWAAAPAMALSAAGIPVYDYVVVRSMPHDPQAFTQGLLYHDGFLYESTGLNGRSSIRKLNLGTGKVLQKKDLPRDVFGEGLAAWNNELVALTWTSHVGYVFDLRSFELKRQFNYPGEGWGLTQDGRQLIMSDGSAELRLLDPQTLKETRRLQVTANGQPVDQLNELEWVGNEIFANIWQTDVVARIDPSSGRVVGWIDLSGLLATLGKPAGQVDVLNGIAWDAEHRKLYVTGKLWPRLFEISLVPRMRQKP